MSRSKLLLMLALFAASSAFSGEGNLLKDPSFENSSNPDKFGKFFPEWGGWKFEGDCKFAVGKIARSGKSSCQLVGYGACKIRISQKADLVPGRYRVTAWIRGLDIGKGKYNQSTEFMFDKKYIQLKKNGTFGWSKLTYVGEVKAQKGVSVSFGMMAPGFFWIDDVQLEKVADDTPLTASPVIDAEEKPITPPEEFGNSGITRCPECGYRNKAAWGKCFACGTNLEVGKKADGPTVKLVASFEGKPEMGGVKVVDEHATEGAKAAYLEKNFADWHGKLDFSGYDYLKIDVYSDETQKFYIEMRDTGTTDYWTRLNYMTIIPAGSSTLILPLDQLFVGEKSRPGRKLDLANLTRFVISILDKPKSPIYFDNIRLERDTEINKVLFDGLYAFDLGKQSSPLMPGFTKISPSSFYSKGRGYGLKDANIWRAYDSLQPEPLYQDFICIQKGGLAVDLPNGKYHVFVNIDNPSGYWGEFQVYDKRSIIAEGATVVEDTMDSETVLKKYYRFWNVEDTPEISTFDKYQTAYYSEKEFDVEVTDGQLNLDFKGNNWACSVSTVIIFPVDKKAEGEKYLEFVKNQRKFFFENYFKLTEHKPAGDPVEADAKANARGFITFTRELMDDVYYNDTPRKNEIDKDITGFGFAGDIEPMAVSIYPLQNLGMVKYEISDLTGPGIIPSSSIVKSFISNRIRRVTMEGTVYTIKPRLLVESSEVIVNKGIARRFWFTVKTPADAKPGLYKGTVTITPEKGKAATIAVEYTVHKGQLDKTDIPVGPWGHGIWAPNVGNDPKGEERNQMMADKSLKKLREYGFTTFTGMPKILYKGFRDGKPAFDFSTADRQMKMARDNGFNMPIVNYCRISGFDQYYKDTAAMKKAGFNDYSKFIKAIFTAIQEHADKNNWLPVYYNLGDEPIKDDLRRSVENSAEYKKAFPKGPPFFTAATSFHSGKADDRHFALAKNLHAANFAMHNEKSCRMLQDVGGNWAFYNEVSRWTYGIYMYKAAKEFDMKFRLGWHWNVCAGDPYYALDCREDDYAWCNSTPDGRLVPSLKFEREIREGVDDYRYILTLSRLAKEKAGTPAASAAQELVKSTMDRFKLGQSAQDKNMKIADWKEWRLKMAAAIDALR